jgi:N-acetyl-beta-hexosaminidase
VHAYFIKRIKDFLKSKNRSLIGWDDNLLCDALTENDTCMVWMDYSSIRKAYSK